MSCSQRGPGPHVLVAGPGVFLSGALVSFRRGKKCSPPPPTALSCFPGICRNLKSIVVQIGIADYFKEPSSPEAQKLFEDMVTKLQVRGGSKATQNPLAGADEGDSSLPTPPKES